MIWKNWIGKSLKYYFQIFVVQDAKTIIEENGDIIIANLNCNICGKDFGKIVLNYNKKTDNHNALEVIDGAPAINFNDVIDAHKFIKDKLK